MSGPNDPTTHNRIKRSYDGLVEAGRIESDAAQLELVSRLDLLLTQLSKKRLSSKSSALGWLLGKSSTSQVKIRGLYVWGGVGRGKSMLMDLFYDNLPHRRKKRVHFNDFMQEAQASIHAHRTAFKAGEVSEEDPIPVVGKRIGHEISVLCFDEFTVTDIADAMILGRLFEVLFNQGVIVVATSNVAPENLYKDGLNRKIFLPFINLLLDNVDVFKLESRTDFRLEKLNRAPVYLTPVNKKNLQIFEETWTRLAGETGIRPETINLKGRSLHIPMTGNGVARIGFDVLCKEARSAEDYLAIARRFHTVFIENIPVMDRHDQNAAKRFILLIDTLYDKGTRIVVTAESQPDELYTAKSGTEAFEFSRTASRLHEMQSHEYLAGSAE